jgi:hypothetical protein
MLTTMALSFGIGEQGGESRTVESDDCVDLRHRPAGGLQKAGQFQAKLAWTRMVVKMESSRRHDKRSRSGGQGYR